jgi:hypothetical protein
MSIAMVSITDATVENAVFKEKARSASQLNSNASGGEHVAIGESIVGIRADAKITRYRAFFFNK